MRGRIVIGLAIVLVLALLPVFGGYLLSADHAAVSRVVYRADAGRVWQALTDFAEWPGWSSAVASMQPGEPRQGKDVWVAGSDLGDMTLVIDRMDRLPPASGGSGATGAADITGPLRMVTRIPEDAGIGFSGTWTYEVERFGDGTVLRITERGHVSNPLLRIVMAFGDAHAGIQRVQRDLGTHFGEEVTPVAVPVDENAG